LVARNRTVKAMRATLAGIPIVSSDWISQCTTSSFEPPSEGMMVRSLPSTNDSCNFGVAALAARLYQDASYQPLLTYHVHLCGTLKRKKHDDFLLLVRQAGGVLLSHASAVCSHIRKGKRVVLVCANQATIPVSIEEQVRLTKEHVAVVSPLWLFDSISSGKALGAESYMPQEEGTTQDLWKLTV
jgi:hypothetical protein